MPLRNPRNKPKGFADHTVAVQAATEKGDLVIAAGHCVASGLYDGGARKTFSGNRVTIMDRRGDDWRSVLDTSN